MVLWSTRVILELGSPSIMLVMLFQLGFVAVEQTAKSRLPFASHLIQPKADIGDVILGIIYPIVVGVLGGSFWCFLEFLIHSSCPRF